MTTSRPDDLKQRYLQASNQQGLRPSARVREAALAHAHMVAVSTGQESQPQIKLQAANRWNFSLVGSVAIAGICALLALQFDRGDSQDKEALLSTRSASAPTATTHPASQPTEPQPEKPVADRAAESAQPQTQSTPSTKESEKKSEAKSLPDLLEKSAALSENSTNASTKANAQPEKPKATPQLDPSVAQALSVPVPANRSPPLNVETESTADSASARRAMPVAPAAAPASTVSSGGTLRNAARLGQLGLLELALRQTSMTQINAVDEKGQTALMLATLGGHSGAVQRLLAAGADASLKDASGTTAAQMAQQRGWIEIGNLLK